MTKVIVTGTLQVNELELTEVRAALSDHAQLTRAEPGCLVFDVVEDPQQPGRFTVYEEFVDQSAFEKHQARARDSQWASVSRNVERSFKVS